MKIQTITYNGTTGETTVSERELTPEEMAVRNDRDSMFLVNEFAQKHF